MLSDDLQTLFLSLWLDVRSLVTFDVAVSSHVFRPSWMRQLKSLRCPAMDKWGHGLSSLMWLSRRGIRVSQVLIKMDACRVRGCDIMLLDTSDIVLLDLGGCKSISDECLTDIVKQSHKTRRKHLRDSEKVIDAGESELGAECGQLQSTNLSGCDKVTDAGVSALGAGCGKLQSIDVEDCDKVTDAGVSALGAGCGRLLGINLEGCNKVTDAGVSALGAGCGQLQSIDLTYCNKVTDAGISALGAGCGQLQSIDLKYCDKVTDAGVSALGGGCGQLRASMSHVVVV